MQQQLDLRQEMALVRSRGLANAQVLAERVEKLSDWREHVRAHPWPIALATGALAYWMIPAKHASAPVLSKTQQAAHQSASEATGVDAERDVKVAGMAGIGGAAMGFVGSLIGNAVRSYISEQVQTLITSRGSHVASQQRQAPLSRF